MVSISCRMMPIENVGAGIDRHAADLLWRHVTELALEDADFDVNFSIACAMPKSSSLTSPS